ncbi:MAG: alkaline phosphatase family protein [Gemmatimonadetes bacterium]|nr:alkaline phosphatase family protein [Gemmatimonadota bacterium]
MKRNYQKIILVVLDGLRPDTVTLARMPHLFGLAAEGWQADAAITVTPSITVAALTSLATGLTPAEHGVTRPGLPPLARLPGLRPLPRELRQLGVSTTVHLPVLGAGARWIAGALLRVGGVTRLCARGTTPASVVEFARQQVEGNRHREFVVVYLNDTDVAGHAWGWMSGPYLQAAARLDRAVARLAPLARARDTLLLVTADHGGGGVDPRDHDALHPLNRRVPLIAAGAGIAAGQAGRLPTHLLDIPPTVLNGFGGTSPAQYAGRVLHEAFSEELVPACG